MTNPLVSLDTLQVQGEYIEEDLEHLERELEAHNLEDHLDTGAYFA